MSIYETIYELGCFTREELLAITKNAKAADSLLYAQKQKGHVQSVKRNLYITISRETKQPVVTPYEVGSKITADAYISHHSAFQYYGIANQVFSDIYVSTAFRFNDFEFDGKNYIFVASKIGLGIDYPSSRLRITNIERTIIDCIKDFTKIGGLEELLRCFTMITFVDESRLIEYLTAYNSQFLFQKTGYILSYFQKSMKLSQEFFCNCKDHINKSTRYLYAEIKHENPIYYQEWRLFAPKDLMVTIDEGGNEIV